MDLWVVAAAAGAEYVAKYWWNLTSNETESSSESFSLYSIHGQSDSKNLLQHIRDQTNPLRGLAGKQDRDNIFLAGEDLTGVTATSNSNSQRQVESYENFNLLSLTSFPPALAENENFRVLGNGERKSNFSDVSGHLRSRYYANYLEPLDSNESSLGHRAQFCRGSRPDFRAENEKQLSRKLQTDIRRRFRRFSMTRECIQSFHSQGLTNAKLLFFHGISVGITSTILVNKKQVENLNELLIKNKNLVQDLQEELEMKDVLNVKEIANEDLESVERLLMKIWNPWKQMNTNYSVGRLTHYTLNKN